MEPLYLQSEVLAFPELKKVILADNANLVMADTIAEGLARLVGRPPPSAAGVAAEPARIQEIEQAVQQLEGELADLEQSLENLRQTLRGE